MTQKLAIFTASLMVLSMALGGIASASEITGTLSVNSSNTGSQSGSNLSGTVVGGTPDSGTIASNSEGGGGGSFSGTGRRSRTQTTSSSANPNDVIIILDDGSAAPASSGTFAAAGTGGGFDPGLEETLAGLEGSEGQISPEDAIAFNTADNPLLNNDLVAAAGDAGISTGRTVAAIVLGLALLGLAGYAVNSLLTYRRENDL